MTQWKSLQKSGGDNFMTRLGVDVYKYLLSIQNNQDYLTDYERIVKDIKPSAEKWQLSDYSPLVLPLVKFYENSLWFISEQLDLFNGANNGKRPKSLRYFYNAKESEIENFLATKINDPEKLKSIVRRLFVTIEDYDQRNKVVHAGTLMTFADLTNYDSLLSKLKELVDVLFDNDLLKKI